MNSGDHGGQNIIEEGFCCMKVNRNSSKFTCL